ncbi:unnamed protein product [Closterium sp. Naga37s-1]|nr:unnamed protein product [Closterium sp. Naga37s-1]
MLRHDVTHLKAQLAACDKSGCLHLKKHLRKHLEQQSGVIVNNSEALDRRVVMGSSEEEEGGSSSTGRGTRQDERRDKSRSAGERGGEDGRQSKGLEGEERADGVSEDAYGGRRGGKDAGWGGGEDEEGSGGEDDEGRSGGMCESARALMALWEAAPSLGLRDVRSAAVQHALTQLRRAVVAQGGEPVGEVGTAQGEEGEGKEMSVGVQQAKRQADALGGAGGSVGGAGGSVEGAGEEAWLSEEEEQRLVPAAPHVDHCASLATDIRHYAQQIEPCHLTSPRPLHLPSLSASATCLSASATCLSASATCLSASATCLSASATCLSASATCLSASATCLSASATCLSASATCLSASATCLSASATCLSASATCLSASATCLSASATCLSASATCLSASATCLSASATCLSASATCLSASATCLSASATCLSASATCFTFTDGPPFVSLPSFQPPHNLRTKARSILSSPPTPLCSLLDSRSADGELPDWSLWGGRLGLVARRLEEREREKVRRERVREREGRVDKETEEAGGGERRGEFKGEEEEEGRKKKEGAAVVAEAERQLEQEEQARAVQHEAMRLQAQERMQERQGASEEQAEVAAWMAAARDEQPMGDHTGAVLGPYPPWVSADEDNVPMTRRAQRDIWFLQHPRDCSSLIHLPLLCTPLPLYPLYNPTQVSGVDEDNLPMTRRAQRDVWLHQHPRDCNSLIHLPLLYTPRPLYPLFPPGIRSGRGQSPHDAAGSEGRVGAAAPAGLQQLNSSSSAPPCTPQVSGADEDNLPMTRRAQRDVWVLQHPRNCSHPSVKFLVVDVLRRVRGSFLGVGAQVNWLAGVLGTAVVEGRVLVVRHYHRAAHHGCHGGLQ